MKKIIDAIKSGETFLITTHINMEGDAIGSMLAVYWLLTALKKKIVMCNHDHVFETYKFLPGADKVKITVKEKKFDVALILDCSNSSRAGNTEKYLARAKSIINIDHHISNTVFGDLNLVDSTAGSTCQILFALCRRLKIMNDNIALCLYAGIFTDTGKFTYDNTDKNTHRITARLMEYDVKPNIVDEALHSLYSPLDLCFIGDIIARLKYDKSGKICWSLIHDWKEKSHDLSEIIFSIMRLLKKPEVFVLIKKIGTDETRVSFRSRHYADVNKIAQFFGGGGHKRASGATIRDSLKSVEQKVISFVKRHINEYKK